MRTSADAGPSAAVSRATARSGDSRRPGIGNDHFAETFDRVAVGMAEVDADGRVLRANRHLAKLIGYSVEELIGRSIFDPELAADATRDRAQFRCQVAGEFDGYTIEKKITRKDGSDFWAHVASSTVRDAEGRFLYAVRVQQDITDRKRAEDQLARRMEQQAALYQLTEQLQRARSFDAVYEHALVAIQRALNCQRAAILLFDQAGVMRFVAWRGLSDRYRAAVEGHSPWSRDTIEPPPVCVEDVAQADLADELKATVREEGIGAVAFIPLCETGRLVGKFMAYYDQPHAFAADEVDVALAVARHLSFGIEQVRAERAAQHLTSIIESSDDAIVSKNLDGIITSWNAGAERLFGYTAAEAIGRSVMMLIPEDRFDEEPGIIARIRNGERMQHYETVRQHKDGRRIDSSLTVSPVGDDADPGGPL